MMVREWLDVLSHLPVDADVVFYLDEGLIIPDKERRLVETMNIELNGKIQSTFSGTFSGDVRIGLKESK